MDARSKKELRELYKNRIVIGGVYSIKCNGNGRLWIRSTRDMVGQKNKFKFSISINSCPESCMLEEWNQYGAGSFCFEILEEMKKGQTQTENEFAEDISILYEMWFEKQNQENMK